MAEEEDSPIHNVSGSSSSSSYNAIDGDVDSEVHDSNFTITIDRALLEHLLPKSDFDAFTQVIHLFQHCFHAVGTSNVK